MFPWREEECHSLLSDVRRLDVQTFYQHLQQQHAAALPHHRPEDLPPSATASPHSGTALLTVCQSVPLRELASRLWQQLEQRRDYRVRQRGMPLGFPPPDDLVATPAEAAQHCPLPPKALLDCLFAGEEQDTASPTTTSGVARKRNRSAAVVAAAPTRKGQTDEVGGWRYVAPTMAFTPGFQPVDHMGRVFIDPLPVAVQAMAARRREPCAPPRVPKRVLQPPQKGGEASRISRSDLRGGVGAHGVQLLRWAPPHFGHLVFSADLQGVTKLWRGGPGGNEAVTALPSAASAPQLIAEYCAHPRHPIKSLQVTRDARRMTTGSTDGTIAVWDVESGQCVQHLFTYDPHSTAAARPVMDHLHHPSDETNVLLAAVDRKLYLYDLREGWRHRVDDAAASGSDHRGGAGYYSAKREYEGHMGTILHVSLLGNGSKLLSTSEDKTLRTWDFAYPLQIMQFADAKMPAISHVLRHPVQQELLAAQSLDNKVMVFKDEGGGRLRQWQHREFVGHRIAGTGCQLGFSHDGEFLSSGDITGRLFIWRWSKGELVKKFQAHQSMLTSHLWHPMEPSRLLTAGWDGAIREWL